MTLDKLTTPFERRRVIEYAKDGNKVVRHWYEVQQVDGAVYKTRDFPDEWGTLQFKLCIFFDGGQDGLNWQWMHQPERFTVDGMKNSAKRYCVDSLTAMLADMSDRMEGGRFVGNTEIEFIRQFDHAAAERFSQYKLDYVARREKKARLERLEREAEDETERAKKRAAEEVIKAKYFGWADTMTPLRFGKARAKLEGFIRSDGKLYQLRDFIISLVKDGWEPVKRDGVTSWYGSKWDRKESKPRTEYVLAKDNYSYKVSKTEYDFAVYLSARKEVLN